MLDIIDDLELIKIVEERLNNKHEVIEVDLNDL